MLTQNNCKIQVGKKIHVKSFTLSQAFYNRKQPIYVHKWSEKNEGFNFFKLNALFIIFERKLYAYQVLSLLKVSVQSTLTTSSPFFFTSSYILTQLQARLIQSIKLYAEKKKLSLHSRSEANSLLKKKYIEIEHLRFSCLA